jgi:thiol:disulfide interchange protein DsbD
MAAVLVLGALYLLIVDRTGHEQPTIDRVMRALSAAMLIAGVVMAPTPFRGHPAEGAAQTHLQWQAYDAAQAKASVSAGEPVIIDFYADWCAPCRELDEKTFADPTVKQVLDGYARFKVDLTKSTEANSMLTSEYRVMGVPTVIVFSGGQEVFRITGFEPPERFLRRLQAIP